MNARDIIHKHNVTGKSNIWDFGGKFERELLKELIGDYDRLTEENKDLRNILGIVFHRKYASRFLLEWRREEQIRLEEAGNYSIAGYPDGDYIYKRYYELKDEIEVLEEKLKSLISS